MMRHARGMLTLVLVAMLLVLGGCSGGGGGVTGGTDPVTPVTPVTPVDPVTPVTPVDPVVPVVPTAPHITSQPLGVALVEGGSAALTVAATGSDLTYQWLRNGNNITGATSASYVVGPVTVGDNGVRLSVRVSNSVGSVTSDDAVLSVTARITVPVIAIQPLAQLVSPGQAATFSVVASGGTSLSYQWLRGGVDIAGARSAVYTTPVTQLTDDGAVYSVRITNGQASVLSLGALLRVTAPPTSTLLIESAGLTAAGSVTYADRVLSHTTSAFVLMHTDAPDQTPQTLLAAGTASAALGTFFEATVDGLTFRSARLRFSVVFRDGRLWRVDHRPATQSAALQQLSTLTSSQVCSSGGYLVGSDRGDPHHGWLFLRAPGPDNTCDTTDDTALAVRLDMTADSVPVALGQPLTAISNATSNFAGVLVRQGDQVVRLDADLANPVPAFTISGDAPQSLGLDFLSSRPTWLSREGSQIIARPIDDPATRIVLTELSASEFLTAQFFAGNEDRSSVFFTISNATGGRVVRVDNTLSTTSVATVPGASIVINDETPNALVMALSNGHVVSVTKSGGTITQLYTLGTGEFLLSLATGGETVYVQILDSTGRQHLRVMNTDGSNAATIANARIITSLWPTTYRLSSSRQALVLASDDSSTTTTLRAIDAATRADLLTYGSIPTMATLVRGSPTQPYMWGDSGLLGVRPASSLPLDLYYFRTDQAGSLVRVPAAAN